MPELRRQAHDDREMPVATGFEEIAGRLTAHRDLYRGVDVARRQPIACCLGAIDLDLHGRLAERYENREILDALHLAERGFDLLRQVRQRVEIAAVDLDRILALHARHRFGDVVLQILREVEFDAGEFGLQLGEHFVGQRILGDTGAPLRSRPQRREEFRIEEAGRVGAVVRPAVLRQHGLELRQLGDRLAHFVDVLIAFLERDRRRQRGADPHIAFFELGQEFQAEHAHDDEGRGDDDERGRDDGATPQQNACEDRFVNVAQEADERGLRLLHLLGQDEGAERRRHREGGEQAAGQGIGIGLGHRPEDMAFHAAHGEQRNEGGDDDTGGKEDRAIDAGRGGGDFLQAAGEPRIGHRIGRVVAFLAAMGETSVDRLHHDDRGIDDQSEIDGADGEQIGRFPARHH